MQIGPAVNFNNSVNRQGLQNPAGFRPGSQQHSSAPETPTEAPQSTSFSDFIQAAEQSAQAREKSEFYSMERNLPFSGQEALNSYRFTSQLPFQSESSQLVGVDIYV
ncbi:MAG: hypothetical protein V7739_01065 [Motiliproteus sp.]